jgi:hypothetical protein
LKEFEVVKEISALISLGGVLNNFIPMKRMPDKNASCPSSTPHKGWV